MIRMRRSIRIRKMFWICCVTHAAKEEWAQDNVEAQGYATYLPRYFDEFKQRPLLLFPRFLFVKTDGHWRFLTGTKGVSQVLMCGVTPSKMSLSQMRQFRQEERDGLIVVPHNYPTKGDRVLITGGAFMSQCGIYQGQTSEARARILIELMYRQVEVQVDRQYLQLQSAA